MLSNSVFKAQRKFKASNEEESKEPANLSVTSRKRRAENDPDLNNKRACPDISTGLTASRFVLVPKSSDLISSLRIVNLILLIIYIYENANATGDFYYILRSLILIYH